MQVRLGHQMLRARILHHQTLSEMFTLQSLKRRWRVLERNGDWRVLEPSERLVSECIVEGDVLQIVPLRFPLHKLRDSNEDFWFWRSEGDCVGAYCYETFCTGSFGFSKVDRFRAEYTREARQSVESELQAAATLVRSSDMRCFCMPFLRCSAEAGA